MVSIGHCGDSGASSGKDFSVHKRLFNAEKNRGKTDDGAMKFRKKNIMAKLWRAETAVLERCGGASMAMRTATKQNA